LVVPTLSSSGDRLWDAVTRAGSGMAGSYS
jgi:hypothetical protein